MARVSVPSYIRHVVFCASVTLKGKCQAAAKFGITAPTVSNHINDLSFELQQDLFVGNTRTQVPTEYGQELARLLSPHFGAIEKILEAAKSGRLLEFASELETKNVAAMDWEVRRLSRDVEILEQMCEELRLYQRAFRIATKVLRGWEKKKVEHIVDVILKQAREEFNCAG